MRFIDRTSQYKIWTSGSDDDYKAVATLTGEPILNTMEILADENAVVSNDFLPIQENISAFKLWQLQKEKLALRQQYLDYWNKSVQISGTGRPVDAIISPMSPYGGAPPHGLNRCLMFTTS